MRASFDREQIWRLLYSSRIADAVAGPDGSAVARGISRASAERNAAAGITGCLLFVDDCFVQVLEGPCDVVEDTFERICRDFRHSEVRLIDFVTVPERLFGDWEMAMLCEDRDTSIALRDELEELRFLCGVNASQAVEQMREVLATQSPPTVRSNSSIVDL